MRAIKGKSKARENGSLKRPVPSFEWCGPTRAAAKRAKGAQQVLILVRPYLLCNAKCLSTTSSYYYVILKLLIKLPATRTVDETYTTKYALKNVYLIGLVKI